MFSESAPRSALPRDLQNRNSIVEGELGSNSDLINKITKGLTIETNLRICDYMETAKSAGPVGFEPTTFSLEG